MINYPDDDAMASTSLPRLQVATDLYSDLSINADKSIAVKFRKGKNICNTDILLVKGTKIQFQNSVLYLGE